MYRLLPVVTNPPGILNPGTDTTPATPELHKAFEEWLKGVRAGAPLATQEVWAVISNSEESPQGRLGAPEADGMVPSDSQVDSRPIGMMQRTIARHPLGLQVPWAL